MSDDGPNQLNLTGDLTNNGTVVVGDSGSGDNGNLIIDAPTVTLSGSGTVDLANGSSYLEGNGTVPTLLNQVNTMLNQGNTIVGPGTVSTYTLKFSDVTTVPPTATTQAASGITPTAATLNGGVNPHGSATSVSFVYGTTDPTLTTGTTTTAAESIGSGTSAVPVTAALTGLQPGTTYYYEVVATSIGGTTDGGPILSFTTLAPPIATTQAASDVTATAAVLNGSVNPQGNAATVSFVYGTDSQLTTGTTTTTAAEPIGGWTSAVPVTAALTGLLPGTTYYYEVVANSAGGTGDGTPPLSFTTVQPALTSIAVAPVNPSAAEGLTDQFMATGIYSDGSTANLTTQVTWASGTNSVATISNTAGSQGLASALATGTTAITAALGGITSPSYTLTVTAAALTSIAVSPTNPTVAKGLTQQFTATGTYSDGSTANLTSQVTWASATASVATISNAVGTQGLATALATGTTVITATLGGVTSPGDTLTVTAAALQSIALSPTNPTVAKGLTQQFTATGTYSDGSTANLTSQVTWASATASVATISNAVGTQGLATALATGTTVITATLGGVTSPGDTLTVTAAALQSIAVSPTNPTVAKGLTQQFTATGTYSDGSTANLTSQVTWASATASVATISNAVGTQGLATALATGTTAITATLGGVTSPGDTLTVTAAALQSIALSPTNPTVAKGLTQQFTATGTYSDGSTANLTSQVTWASATASVATISNAAAPRAWRPRWPRAPRRSPQPWAA